jgi:predicted transport protein
VVELYRALDQFCLSLSPGGVEKRFLKMSIRYQAECGTFCWLHLQQGGIRAWLPLKYSRLDSPPDFARDVSNVGHFAGGDLELRLTDESQLPAARELIRQAYETV